MMMDVCQRLSFAWCNSERLSSFQPVHGHFFQLFTAHKSRYDSPFRKSAVTAIGGRRYIKAKCQGSSFVSCSEDRFVDETFSWP